jgi:hypothetical protein
LRQRRSRTQVMEMMYDERRATVPRDIMALKATDDPILIKERRETMTKLAHSAFKGTVNVGLTCELSLTPFHHPLGYKPTFDKKLEKGSPLSRANA